MSGRYRGYFNSLDRSRYIVELEKSGATGAYQEITLAGEEPFVVSYNASDTPFDPIRTSVATINVVCDDYLTDIFSDRAQETRVTLYKSGQTNTVEWQGFLTPQLYDMDYVNCLETISLNASDCLSSLQYIDYETKTADTRQIVTFKDLINQICDKCRNLDGYYWTRSKTIETTVVEPDKLKINEWNFFSSDTDEPWKLKELLGELCKYVGMTCLQWKNRLYFIDYQYFHSNTSLSTTYYSKANNYSGTVVTLSNPITISQNTYRGNNNNITFLPIYNKIKVNCNFTETEDFIPSIFEDSYLTNATNSGNFYTNYDVQPKTPYKPSYPWGGSATRQKYSDEEVADDKYYYRHRQYQHKYWEGVYMNYSGDVLTPPSFVIGTDVLMGYYAGGTIVDLGVKKKDELSEQGQMIIPSKYDYTRYLCLSQLGRNWAYQRYSKPLFRLKAGYKSPVPFTDNSYLIINYSTIFEKYKWRPYINPEWTQRTVDVRDGNSQSKRDGNLWFRLGIGDKFWNGSEWVENPNTMFQLIVEKSTDTIGYMNTEMTLLNRVTSDLNLNEEGWPIPLSGCNMEEDVIFEFLAPSEQVIINNTEATWNQFCWVKDLSIKCVEKGQGIERKDNDVIYENEIDVDAVNEMDDIDLKFTTYTELSAPSSSNVLYYDGTMTKVLTGINEQNITTDTQKPEENIVQKYVQQYSSSTKKLGLELDLTITPYSLITNAYLDNPTEKYVVLGQDIDYSRGKQEIKLIQKK